MSSATIPEMPTQRLLSGLYVPADLGESTAPIDVVDQPQPDPVPSSVPDPATEQPRPEPDLVSAAPVEVFRPETPTPAPEPVATSTTTPPPTRPAPQPKPEPQPLKPPSAPIFWGSRALEAVYWIAILTGAIGQVIFFGGLFDLGWPGYVAAGIIATTAETIMISAGDTALKFFTNGVPGRRWWIFLAVSIVAACTAAALNVTHWVDKNVSMAVLFGGIAMLGYILHVTDGFVRAIAYREAKAAYEAEVQRREAEAAKAAAPPRTTALLRPAASKSTKTKTKTSSKRKAGKPRLTPEQAKAWSEENRKPGPSAVINHFKAQGYDTPSVATMRRWLNS
ncbi:hypothetical protein [Saccharomonospora glauca]|uniref:Uncharacterized protein n=1 Tax=Saccharomonospora glauca K62 TaxID=928724 RepID=I1D8G3_9PSEU|nr:hypothetical protein [Saccharomonospora glauca]EIF01238.1 hypothetical protein SacglDRAFT_00024 [Saccharomonospora glauca K62]